MVVPVTHDEEDDMQGKRTRALDSRGRPVPGLYIRDGSYIAGLQCPQTGKWRMQTLDADTLTDARRERDSCSPALREERISCTDRATFGDVFAEHQDARTLSAADAQARAAPRRPAPRERCRRAACRT